MSEIEEHMELFRQETDELLAEMNDVLLEMEKAGSSDEGINRIFRAIHSIKGSSAMCDVEAIADFSHRLETVLARVRSREIPIGGTLLGRMLAATDHIKRMLDAFFANQTVAADETERVLAGIEQVLPAPAAQRDQSCPAPAHSAAAPEPARGPLTAFFVVFAPPVGLLDAGVVPEELFDELAKLGPCQVLESTRGDGQRRWRLLLFTDQGENGIHDVFFFLEDGAPLLVEELGAVAPERVEEAFDGGCRFLREHSEAGFEQVREFWRGLAGAAGEGESPKLPAGQGLNGGGGPVGTRQSLRVPADRLDLLVGLVGEIVIAQARLAQLAAAQGESRLGQPVEEMSLLIAGLRDLVLNIRMMPVHHCFRRLARLVRDLSRELGKEAEFVTAGSETELDKTMLDRLGDPLMHIIRNSLDHGIGRPEEREAAGKPRRATIRLSAAHKGTQVLISIADDGAGIDPEKVRAEAQERGLLAPGANPTKRELLSLLFAPGFSTRSEVTKLSGRGVGLDVVRREIEALRGSVEIESEPGRGTTITLGLPLTLAIIEGLLVQVAGQVYVLPLASVRECVDFTLADWSRASGMGLLRVREESVPVLFLHRQFGLTEDAPEMATAVILEHQEMAFAVVVDKVLGDHQTVVKSLGPMYRRVDLVAGSTLLGDGTVALILDVAGLLRALAGAAPKTPFITTQETSTTQGTVCSAT